MPIMDAATIAERRRPAWTRRAPKSELDCRRAGRDPSSIFKETLDEAVRLRDDALLSVVIDFEPLLLYRMLEDMGFQHWTEPPVEGWLRVYFRRAAADGLSAGDARGRPA